MQGLLLRVVLHADFFLASRAESRARGYKAENERFRSESGPYTVATSRGASKNCIQFQTPTAQRTGVRTKTVVGRRPRGAATSREIVHRRPDAA